MSESFWYNINETLSHNCLFNFIVGPRGNGKTYGAKEWAIKDFLKTGSQFIYLRRYKPELKKNKQFFNDIRAAFETTKLDVNGMSYKIDDKDAGIAVPLSTSKIEKSTPYPKVNKIIFDEFIIDKGTYHYLQDEVLLFLEFYETVARMRNDVKVFFISNAITFANPYFSYFNLNMPYGKNIYKRGDLLLQMIKNDAFVEAKKDTRFGKIIDGTQYADYSIENKFLRDSDTFIEKKYGNPRYYFTFKYHEQFYGVWISYDAGKIWVSNDVDTSCKLVYTLTLSDHSPNTLLVKSLSRAALFKTFINAYKNGVVFFESQRIKAVVYDVIKMIIT